MSSTSQAPSQVDERPIWTPAEVADRWRMSARQIERMLHDGTLRGFRCGNRWRITAEALREHEQGGPA